jgi:hypothetical protein
MAGKRKPGTGPQRLLTMLFHLATGLPWAWQRGRGDESERGHLEAMASLLPIKTLLVADAGYVGYEMLLYRSLKQTMQRSKMLSERPEQASP